MVRAVGCKVHKPRDVPHSWTLPRGCDAQPGGSLSQGLDVGVFLYYFPLSLSFPMPFPLTADLPRRCGGVAGQQAEQQDRPLHLQMVKEL